MGLLLAHAHLPNGQKLSIRCHAHLIFLGFKSMIGFWVGLGQQKPKYTVLTEQRNNKGLTETAMKLLRASWNLSKSRDRDRGSEWGIYVTISNISCMKASLEHWCINLVRCLLIGNNDE